MITEKDIERLISDCETEGLYVREFDKRKCCALPLSFGCKYRSNETYGVIKDNRYSIERICKRFDENGRYI